MLQKIMYISIMANVLLSMTVGSPTFGNGGDMGLGVSILIILTLLMIDRS